MAITDIVGYSFRADIYCPEHVVDVVTSTPEYEGWALAAGVDMPVEANLSEIAAAFGIDREREYTFDGDEFPKRVFRWELEGAETCSVCREPLD